jgi:hypothetical protein
MATEYGASVERIRPIAAGLEDVFISLLEKRP